MLLLKSCWKHLWNIVENSYGILLWNLPDFFFIFFRNLVEKNSPKFSGNSDKKSLKIQFIILLQSCWGFSKDSVENSSGKKLTILLQSCCSFILYSDENAPKFMLCDWQSFTEYFFGFFRNHVESSFRFPMRIFTESFDSFGILLRTSTECCWGIFEFCWGIFLMSVLESNSEVSQEHVESSSEILVRVLQHSWYGYFLNVILGFIQNPVKISFEKCWFFFSESLLKLSWKLLEDSIAILLITLLEYWWQYFWDPVEDSHKILLRNVPESFCEYSQNIVEDFPGIPFFFSKIRLLFLPEFCWGKCLNRMHYSFRPLLKIRIKSRWELYRIHYVKN